MKESVYRFAEVVGTHPDSWEKAAAAAVRMASKAWRDLRIAEVTELDLQVFGGGVISYRAKVKISYRWDGNESTPESVG